MIRETLTSIGLAGHRALTKVTAQHDWTTQVIHVREWSFTMPHVARITVANSPVHQVYVGFSRSLVRNLGPNRGARLQAMEQLMEILETNLVASLPVKRPIVTWEQLEPSAEPRVMRGFRSFVQRHQGGAGGLYLMADLASRQEYESLRDPAWTDQLAEQHFPADIGQIDCIENRTKLDAVSAFLSRCEHDLELLIPDRDGVVHAVNAVVMQRFKVDGGHSLRLSVDLDRRLDVQLTEGLEVEGAFGAAGRVFRFRSRCLGESELGLDNIGHLPCMDMEFPRRFELDQRRRHYRLAPPAELTAELKELGDPANGLDIRINASVASVVDLSFSGAGLALKGSAPTWLRSDAKVRVKLLGTALSQPLGFTGIVRRIEAVPCGRGRETTLLGLEFVVNESGEQQDTRKIRDYIMACERNLLRNRDHTAGNR